ncbi:MAG: GAK system CofD-like protein [Desulfobacterales bacterium]|nr:GAK system CofD-like protein [Desulfobacterales bacterium]
MNDKIQPSGGAPLYFQMSRTARLPDPFKLARYQKSPDLGPRPLFFSGGTALRALSRELIRYTRNSIHIITPFDSGGSSAELRKVFHMPAVGDIRNRLMALADQSFQGQPEIFDLFVHRLAKDAAEERLAAELARMARGTHPLVSRIPEPMCQIIRSHLHTFLNYMPASFSLKGASIGNLILAAGYLDNHHLLDPIIYTISNLVQARGTVRPVVADDRHLAAEMDSGELIIGQHQLTGKESRPIASRIHRLYLCHSSTDGDPAEVEIDSGIRSLIQSAELICYPMGSFYSSIIANLLPKGVGHAVSRVHCPKIYIPNTGEDPESYGLDPTRQTEILLSYLKADDPEKIENQAVLNLVLVDKKHGRYACPIDEERLNALGIEVMDYPLITKESAPSIAADRLAECLLSMT